jgi:hypothetical protein
MGRTSYHFCSTGELIGLVVVGVVLGWLLSCVGCYVPPTLPSDEVAPIEAVIDAVREKYGLEVAGALSGLHVEWAPNNTEFARLCASARVVAACNGQKTTLGGRSYPRIVLRPGQPAYDPDGCSVLSHEAIHIVVRKLGWGPGYHDQHEYFGEIATHPNSLEGIACRLLRERR